MSSDCNDQGCIVTMKSSPAEKIRLMSSMFYGRRDVFARRYERKDDAPVEQLKNLYERILNQENVVGLNIATRPDSITDECLDYLTELKKKTYLKSSFVFSTILMFFLTQINFYSCRLFFIFNYFFFFLKN